MVTWEEYLKFCEMLKGKRLTKAERIIAHEAWKELYGNASTTHSTE